MTKIVILGGGFAGVAAGLYLSRHKISDTKITLIDRNTFHLFTPSLYEVATSEEPQKNIAIPFVEIFKDKITLLQCDVEKIDAQSQGIILSQNKSISYDYLIIALGSESAYYNIDGLKKHAVTLKTLSDAVSIKNKIKSLCCKEGVCNKKINVVIGGGGFSGTELAAELLMYKERLAKQHHLSTDCLQVSIIQRSDRLLKELDAHVSDTAQKRISGSQTKLCFGGQITKVTEKEVITDDNKIYPYDILIWTGGVMGNNIVKNSKLPANKRGQIIVDEFLQMQGTQNVFAAGDIAGYINFKTKELVPNVVQVAEDEGNTAGENIYRSILGKPLKKYSYLHLGYIVPLRGRFAAAEFMWGLHIDGFFGWVIQQLVFFYYLLKILPFWKAFKRWNTFELKLYQ